MRPTEAAWEEQVTLYELGLRHASEIARALGVAPSTVSRQMRCRGAVKNSRVGESIQDLEVALDRKARCAALMKLSDSQRRRLVAEANMKAVGAMVEALLEADRRGALSQASPAIDRVGGAVSVRRRRRTKG